MDANQVRPVALSLGRRLGFAFAIVLLLVCVQGVMTSSVLTRTRGALIRLAEHNPSKGLTREEVDSSLKAFAEGQRILIVTTAIGIVIGVLIAVLVARSSTVALRRILAQLNECRKRIKRNSPEDVPPLDDAIDLLRVAIRGGRLEQQDPLEPYQT